MKVEEIKSVLGATDMYLIDLLQKGYFDTPGSVIDVGCGSGRNLKLLMGLEWLVTAMDENPDVFKSDFYIANKRKVETRVGELGLAEGALGRFDFVICNAVLHFAKNRTQFKSMFLHLIQLQKPGGVIFCRFVSSHTLSFRKEQLNNLQELPDGTMRFIVDYTWLMEEFIPNLNVTFLEVPKTVNVDQKRSMTTLVMRAK